MKSSNNCASPKTIPRGHRGLPEGDSDPRNRRRRAGRRRRFPGVRRSAFAVGLSVRPVPPRTRVSRVVADSGFPVVDRDFGRPGIETRGSGRIGKRIISGRAGELGHSLAGLRCLLVSGAQDRHRCSQGRRNRGPQGVRFRTRGFQAGRLARRIDPVWPARLDLTATDASVRRGLRS